MARVAFIVGADFEDSELRVPYDGVKQAGHEAVIVGEEKGKAVEGKKGKEERLHAAILALELRHAGAKAPGAPNEFIRSACTRAVSGATGLHLRRE